VSSAQRTAREQVIYDSLVYPGGDVLRNKLGITSRAALDRAEKDQPGIASENGNSKHVKPKSVLCSFHS